MGGDERLLCLGLWLFHKSHSHKASVRSNTILKNKQGEVGSGGGGGGSGVVAMVVMLAAVAPVVVIFRRFSEYNKAVIKAI